MNKGFFVKYRNFLIMLVILSQHLGNNPNLNKLVNGASKQLLCDRKVILITRKMTKFRPGFWPVNMDMPTRKVGLPCGSAGKESACNAGDLGSIPGLGRPPGEGIGYPLQYPGLDKSMDCIVHGVTKSRTQLSDFHCSQGNWGGEERRTLPLEVWLPE